MVIKVKSLHKIQESVMYASKSVLAILIFLCFCVIVCNFIWDISASVALLPGQPLFQGLACFFWVFGWFPEPAQSVRDTVHMRVHT